VTAAPSVIGRPLAEAQDILRQAGAAVARVDETRPPRGAPEGPLRVIRQQDTDDGVLLVVAASLMGPEKPADGA
jgi:hypothetical protein